MPKTKEYLVNFGKKNRLIICYILLALLPILFWIYKGTHTLIPNIKETGKRSTYQYEAKNRYFSSYFAQKESTTPSMRFEMKKSAIVIEYPQEGFKTSKISNREIEFKKKGITLRYKTLEDGIKEEIILASKPESNDFSFDFWIDNVQLKENTNISYSPLFFDNEGNFLFHFSQPFAVDAKGNTTYDATYRLSKGSKGKYVLVLSVNEDWLNDKNRKYPVTIDPTITITTGYDFLGTSNRSRNINSPLSISEQAVAQELSADNNTAGLWHLNETSDGQCPAGHTPYDACDFSGNYIHLTNSSSTIESGGPLNNYYRTTNGSSTYMYASQAPTTAISNWTVEAWIKPANLAHVGLAVKVGNGSGGYGFGIGNGAGASGAMLQGLIANVVWVNTGYTFPSANEWYHVAMVRDTVQTRFYVNGVKTSGVSTSTPIAPSQHFSIGMEYNASNVPARYFNGSVEEVRISTTARTESEIKMSAQKRPYSTFTSDVIDLTNVNQWNSFTWSESGVYTEDGETLKDNTGLVAQWNFNEDSGTTANNNAGSCGASCNGTLTNFASTGGRDVATMSGWTANNKRWGAGSIMFDGTNDYVDITDNDALSFGDSTTDSPFSFESWVYFQKTTSVGIASKYTTTPSNLREWIIYADSSDYLRLQLYDNSTGGNMGRRTEAITNLYGKWAHIAATYDGSSSSSGIKIYINGVQQDTADVNSGTYVAMENTSRNMNFGRWSETSYFKGILDSFRIFSRTLSASEILSNYNSSNLELQTRVGNTTNANDGSWEEWKPVTNETQILSLDSDASNWSWSPTSTYTPKSKGDDSVIKATGTGSLKITTGSVQADANTVALWNMDQTGGTGAYLKDSSGNNLHLTPNPSIMASMPGVVNKAKWFNGSSFYADVANSAPLELSTTHTLSVWVNRKTDTGGYERILSKSNETGYDYWMQIENTDTFSCGVTKADGNTYFRVSSTTIPLSSWTHLACTFDSASGFNMYINGLLSNGSATGTLGAGRTSSKEFNVGRLYSGGAWNYGFTGYIDEIIVSNVVRSAEEIAEISRLGQNQYLTRTISSTDLSDATTIPFYIASDRVGTFSSIWAGETAYTSYLPDSDTTGLWNLEEENGSGAYLLDTSGNGYHGTPASGAKFTEGKIGKGRNLAGPSTSNYITLGHGALDGVTDFTIEAWAATATNTNLTLISGANASQFNEMLFYFGTSLVFNPFLKGTAYTGTYVLPTDSLWHHYAMVRNGTTLYLYVDGVLVDTINSVTAAALSLATNGLVVGQEQDALGGGFAANQAWNGPVDQVRISSIARSAQDIQRVYELSKQAYDITIDFAASLSSTNKITDSNDLSFTIDAKTSGLQSSGSRLYKGDKVIVKDNYDGIEYFAQGTVDSINISTGAVTVSSWDNGSTFPSGGYSQYSQVFKWQKEYWPITEPLNSSVDGITRLNFSITNGSLGSNMWLDDIRKSTGYLTNPSGSSIASSVGNRYFQYKIIQTSSNTNNSSSFSGLSLDYEENASPDTPTLGIPNNATVSLIQPFNITMSSTDLDDDNLQFKIELCLNKEMTIGCQIVDQTQSQTGWSGQNADGNTTYTPSTTATYSMSGLDYGQTYYWRTYAIDPSGSNMWSGTQSTPRYFITNAQSRPASSSALTIYSARRVSEEPTTTMYWTPVTGSADSGTTASTNGWIGSSNLTAGRKYLIIASGSHSTDNTSGKSGLRVKHGNSVFQHSESIDQTNQTTAAYKTPYFWFTIWTAVEGQNLEVEQYWNGVGNQARAEDVSLVVIDAQDLIANQNLIYNENTNYTNLTTSFQDTSSISFTPSNNKDSWWIMGYNHTSLNNEGATSRFENRITINSNVKTTSSIKINGSSISPVMSLGWGTDLENTSTNISIQAREVDSNQVSQASAIFALRLNTFENFYASNTDLGSEMTSSGGWIEQMTFNSLNKLNNSEWIVAGGGNVDDNGARVIGRIQVDGLSITDDIGGWEQSTSDNTPLLLMDYIINLSSGNKAIKFETQTTLPGTANVNNPWIIAFSRELYPNYTSMDSPSNGNQSVPLRPPLKMTAVDPDSNYLRYKVQMCSDFAMTQSCQTFDQTSSQVGWTGKNADENTAYTSGTQATYTPVSNLNSGQTYFWRAYSIDYQGTNQWTTSNPNPYSFKVTSAPIAPTNLWAEGVSNPTNVVDLTPELSSIYNDTDGDNSASYQIQVNTQNDFLGTMMWDSGKHSMIVSNGQRSSDVSYNGTALSYNGATYYWRMKFWDTHDTSGAWSSVSQFTMREIDVTTGCYLVKNPSTTQITIKWKDNSTMEEGYRIERKVDGGSFSTLIDKDANTTSHTDSTMSIGHVYTYRIGAITGTSIGSWCTTTPANVQQGSILFEGLNMDGIQIR